ncbi:MAG: tetratricopeptide repeat protein [Muribaculaceae bacterium]|nr:tetratricopeptide repeat protein [Muribaculaceae bacterium]
MKHRLIIFLTLALMSLTSLASGIDYIDQGNKAYDQKQFKKAVEMYERALRDGESSQLRYNLGNAYYRLNDRANAVLNFERALKLAPSNGDARFNLKFVNEKSKINETSGSNYFSSLLSDWVGHLSSNTWAIISLALFVLMLAGIACYRIASSVALQKTGFFGAIVMGILALLALASAFYMYHHTTKTIYAIVMTDKTPANKSPRDGEKEEFKLPSGTKVEIVDSISNKNSDGGTWYMIETTTNKTGWIKKADLEKI